MKTPQIGGFYDTSLPDPILRYDRATNRFVLMGDYVTPEYTVPKGEFTDGASRPEFTNLFVKQYDRHLPACIVHDWMYRNAIATKQDADKQFHANLIRCGVNHSTAMMMYRAVVFGGKGAYK